MRIVCKMDFTHHCVEDLQSIKLNQSYVVLDREDIDMCNTFTIINDLGKRCSYSQDYFYKKDEWRNLQLTKII